jgi:hypothetical protein
MMNQISDHIDIQYLIIQEFPFQSDIVTAELAERHIHVVHIVESPWK